MSETPIFDAVKADLKMSYLKLATYFRRLPSGEVEAKYNGKWVNITNEATQ